MDFFSGIIRFFQEGGWFMYPIVLVLALGIAIAMERYISLTRAKRANKNTWNDVAPKLGAGDYDEALDMIEGNHTAIGKIIGNGLSRLNASHSRPEVEAALEESVMETMPQFEKRTHYLATLANVATLLGLLGTIMGLIQAFTAVANVNPAEKADLLSASISVAMNTTAFGLMAAIPLLLIHAVLQTKTTELVDSLEMASVKFLNTLTESRLAAKIAR
jgi:biopolymer transport protein ExbB